MKSWNVEWRMLHAYPDLYASAVVLTDDDVDEAGVLKFVAGNTARYRKSAPIVVVKPLETRVWDLRTKEG